MSPEENGDKKELSRWGQNANHRDAESSACEAKPELFSRIAPYDKFLSKGNHLCAICDACRYIIFPVVQHDLIVTILRPRLP
jgi:hypothetical protein